MAITNIVKILSNTVCLLILVSISMKGFLVLKKQSECKVMRFYN